MQQMQSIWMMLHTKSPLKMWVMLFNEKWAFKCICLPKQKSKNITDHKGCIFYRKKESYILKQTKCTKKAQF